MTGTIHPLQTFPNINCSDRLYKIPYAIESNHKEVVDWLYNFAKSFEGIPLKLSPEFRNIYHAAAVTSCALLSSLIAISSDMLDFLKLDDETRISMLIPIIYSTVEGISNTLPLSLSAHLTNTVDFIKTSLKEYLLTLFNVR